MSIKKLFGNKNFYKAVAIIVLPIILQNALNNIVNFVDTLMLGRIGKTPMDGVGIVNRLILIFSLCVFGATAGAGIFTAQYYGSKNHKGVRETIVFKFYITFIICAVFSIIFAFFTEDLIKIFLQNGNKEVLEETLKFAKMYFIIAIFAQIPNSITQIYANTLRETGRTLIPMIASLIAVVINIILNGILIFGAFGLKPMGVQGAAIATVISRVIECLFLVIYSHTHTEEMPFFKNLFKNFKVPKNMIGKLTQKSLSLLLNESLWAIIQAGLVACYALKGDNVLSAMNIASSIHDIFCIVFTSLASSIGIMVGNLLGAGKIEEAKDTNTKILTLAMLSSIILAIILASFSPLIVKIYNIDSTVRDLALKFLLVVALFMPLHALIHSCYFTLRAGGKALLTFIFDSLYSAFICLPLALILAKFTSISAPLMFLLVCSADIVKAIIGIVLLKKGIWLNNIVKNENKEPTLTNCHH